MNLHTIIGHISSETTLNIYTHITDNMQRSAADKIERGFGRNEGTLGGDRKTPDQAPETPVRAKFEPKQPKIRCPGTGCVTMINDHLYEGRYTPTNAYGKRESHNIYAKTREECEEKLAEMIVQVKAQIKAEKDKMTGCPKKSPCQNLRCSRQRIAVAVICYDSFNGKSPNPMQQEMPFNEIFCISMVASRTHRQV